MHCFSNFLFFIFGSYCSVDLANAFTLLKDLILEGIRSKKDTRGKGKEGKRWGFFFPFLVLKRWHICG